MVDEMRTPAEIRIEDQQARIRSLETTLALLVAYLDRLAVEVSQSTILAEARRVIRDHKDGEQSKMQKLRSDDHLGENREGSPDPPGREPGDDALREEGLE